MIRFPRFFKWCAVRLKLYFLNAEQLPSYWWYWLFRQGAFTPLFNLQETCLLTDRRTQSQS